MALADSAVIAWRVQSRHATEQGTHTVKLVAGLFDVRRLLVLGALLALAIALAAALAPRPAAAHPLGNFTINRYSRLEFAEDRVRITYVLDFAEIPTFQQLELLDPDGDGTVTDAERAAYLDEIVPLLVDGLRLVVGDEVVRLAVDDQTAELSPGQGGLSVLRIEAHFSAALPAGWQQDGFGGYTDRNYQDRLGWREVVVQGGPGVAIEGSSAPVTDVSNALRVYPEDALQSPLDMSEATFTLVPGNGAVAGDSAGQAAQRVQETAARGRATDRVAALITAEEMTPAVISVSLLLAFFWGAVHALSPGHGKTIVAAYLVGARGTARHAAFLGLTVTITHTAGVFALGLVTLYLSRYILPEDLYPWLSAISGLLVVAIGVTLIRSRLRGDHAHHHHHDHDHDHDHEHTHDHDHDHPHHSASSTQHSHLPPGADGSRVTWRSLLALGVSGGLIPCPSALVLLLGAISLERVGFGMVLVVAFSVGLAAVLTAIGLLLVYARRLFERHAFTPRVPRLLPVASAAIVSLAGAAIVVESLRGTGIV
jgi:ABC-type nickel/cobalt efflux system permease component RcnA